VKNTTETNAQGFITYNGFMAQVRYTRHPCAGRTDGHTRTDAQRCLPGSVAGEKV